MRLGRVEVSAGCLLLLAWLNYWDTQGVVPLALAACLLHELAHYGALRLAGAGVRRVRLTFRDSVTTGTPLVARLASEEGILCTVISASTQKLSEEVYGSMLLGIPSGQFQRAMDYIDTMSNIRVEEVDGHVQ